MNKSIILVEGDSDVDFIKFLLDRMEIPQEKYEIIKNGSNGISDKTIPLLSEARDSGNKIIIINDADNDYTKRKKELDDKLKKHKLEAKIYLFPDDKGLGELEDLLFMCIPDKKKFTTDCFDTFVECLKVNKKDCSIYLPANKSKLFACVDVQLDDDQKKLRNKNKDKSWIYDIPDLWIFDIPQIKKLEDFLRTEIL